MSAASPFGRSLSFPPRVGADGRMRWSDGEENIRESIGVILRTDPGERVALGAFGAGLNRFLFEPNNPATHVRIQGVINAALTRWEPRIKLDSVDVGPDPTQADAAVATIGYRLVATGDQARVSVTVPLAAA